MSRMIDKVLTKRAGGVRQTIDVEARTATFIFSTNSVDRAGDIIDQASWNLDRYKSNPQFLWAHRSRELPIGKTIDLVVKGNQLIGKVQFATAEENPFAEICWNLVKGGYLSAVSVGFIPHRWETYEDNGVQGAKLYDCELLECSLVPIPCNQDCLVGPKDLGDGAAVLLRQCTDTLAAYDDSLVHVFDKGALQQMIVKDLVGGNVTVSGDDTGIVDLGHGTIVEGTNVVRNQDSDVSTPEGEAVYDSDRELMGIMVGGALKMTRTYQDKLRARNLSAISEQAGDINKPATNEKQAGSVTRTFFLRNAKAAARRRRAAIGM